MALPVVFKYGTRAQYDGLTSKAENALYFLTDTGEIYHGAKNLARGSHYEGIRGEGEDDNAVFERVLGKTPAVKDDIFVVKALIGIDADDNESYSYTSYVYDGENWRAMDGNYNAKNVYFDADLTATAPIGVVTIPSSGSTTIAAEGKTLDSVLKSILAERKDPVVTQPKVTVQFTNAAKAYEVGSAVTPTYSASMTAGSYSYGPATEIAATKWTVTNSNDYSVDGAIGSFPEITVEDAMSYSATAVAEYDDGAMPKDNLGNDAPTKQILAGSVSGTTSAKITGYRNFFYGMLATSTAEEPLTSAVIRSLTAGGAYNAKKSFSMDASQLEGVKRMVIAYPANTSRGGLESVKLPNSLDYNALVNGDYVQAANIDVEGANGYTAIPYIVYVYEPATIDPSEVHNAVLA